jgi:hypothetical protein
MSEQRAWVSRPGEEAPGIRGRSLKAAAAVWLLAQLPAHSEAISAAVLVRRRPLRLPMIRKTLAASALCHGRPKDIGAARAWPIEIRRV